MGRPKSAKKKELDLRFRSDLLLRLRVKRLALFYGGNASALMGSTVLIRLQDEERHLSLPSIETVETPITKKFSSYSTLPKEFKQDADRLTVLIQQLGEGVDENVVMAEYERLYPASKNSARKPVKFSESKIESTDELHPENSEECDPPYFEVSPRTVPVELPPNTPVGAAIIRKTKQR